MIGNNKETATALSIGIVLGTVVSSRMISALVIPKAKPPPPPPVRVPGFKGWRMSKWIKHDGILRTQGLVGDASKVPGSSTAQQMEEALAKLDAILNEANVPRKNLLSVRIYVAKYTPDNLKEMNDVYDKWVDPEGLPTRICVEAGIGDFAVEIQAEAYYDE